MRANPLHYKEPFDVVFRVMFRVSGVICAALGIGVGVMVALDGSRSTFERVAAFLVMCLIIGIAVPCWLFTVHIFIKVKDPELAVGMWPLSGTRVPLSSVTAVEVARIDPLGEYKGWGVKGSKADRFYGGAGTEAVRVAHRVPSGEERRLTFLSTQTEPIAEAVRMRAPSLA